MIGLDNVSLDVILPTSKEKERTEMKEFETEDIIRIMTKQKMKSKFRQGTEYCNSVN